MFLSRQLFFFFVFNLVFLSRYMQSEGLWQRQHAAVPRKQETAAFSLHRYTPFLPRTSLRSYSGVSQRLLLPISTRKHNPKQKERVKHHLHPHTQTATEGKHARPLLLCGPMPLSSRLLHLDLRYFLLLKARGCGTRNLPPLFPPSWWGR